MHSALRLGNMLDSLFISYNNADDIEAIAAFFRATPVRSPEAQGVKNKFMAWYQTYSNSLFSKVATDESFHTAANFRDEFNRANAITKAQEQAVKSVQEYGLTRNEMLGIPPGTVDLWTKTKRITKWIGVGVAVAGVGYLALQTKTAFTLIKRIIPGE